MPLATRRNPGTYGASDGSRTLTMRDDQPREDDGAAGGSGAPGAGSSTTDAIGVLHLHGGPRPARRVMWTEETVDNEGAGRKKSKSTSSELLLSRQELMLRSLLYLPQAPRIRRIVLRRGLVG
jgi:hypothetical protein